MRSDMPTEGEKPPTETFLSKHGPFIVYIIIVAILVDSLLNLGYLSEIRWQHLVLIGGLLFIPFFREVDHVFVPNVGGFQMGQTKEWKSTMQEVLEEASFGGAPGTESQEGRSGNAEEAEEAEGDAADENTNTVPNRTENLGGYVDEIAEELYSLAENNPRLAISKLGMELEHGLRHLIHSKGMTPALQYQDMIAQLRKNEAIDERFIHVAQQVRHARNEAVHSTEFDIENTAGLIEVGMDLLKYINESTKSEKIPQEEPPTQTR